jgi:F0F1-type ATP synthase assembly protein I
VNRAPAKTSPGLGDPFSTSAELAVSIVAFMGLGWLVDRALGTQPTFMIVGVLFGIVGQFVRLYYAYKIRMDELEEQRRQVARR